MSCRSGRVVDGEGKDDAGKTEEEPKSVRRHGFRPLTVHPATLHSSHTTAAPVDVTPSRRSDRRQATRLLLSHLVHPINCANKTVTHDQTNRPSTLLRPADRAFDDQEQRMWNITFLLECEL